MAPRYAITSALRGLLRPRRERLPVRPPVPVELLTDNEVGVEIGLAGNVGN